MKTFKPHKYKSLFSKKPKWKFHYYKHKTFSFIPILQKSYSLSEPMWKDKFGTPRCERCPYISLYWLNIEINAQCGNDEYWEKYLWIHEYNNGDEIEAQRTWPWMNQDKKSTWYDE